MTLLEILDPQAVKIGIKSRKKMGSCEELIDLLVKAGRVMDRAAAVKAIRVREEVRSTGIGRGVAIPHGKDKSILKITGAAGTSREGIEFDAIDGKPVHLVFLVLAQVDNPGPHLQTLSDIAMCLNVPEVYERLVGAGNAEEFLCVLRDAGKEVA